MLVLSRRKDQFIDIDGGRIQICIVEVRGDKVRIGITAPREISVHRREIQEEINRESLRLQSEHDPSEPDFD
jgi:carbon storage regulator